MPTLNPKHQRSRAPQWSSNTASDAANQAPLASTTSRYRRDDQSVPTQRSAPVVHNSRRKVPLPAPAASRPEDARKVPFHRPGK